LPLQNHSLLQLGCKKFDGKGHGKNMSSGIAHLRPRARIIRLIGDELISDEPVALVELVKNSYDADATQVTIRFLSDEAGEVSRIVVEDDGVGMTVDTVINSWFEPGTATKKLNPSSKKGRVFLVAKGDLAPAS
jgi:Histidine kinase-, DNA gyrase B-, and HSP90-like ATPase